MNDSRMRRLLQAANGLNVSLPDLRTLALAYVSTDQLSMLYWRHACLPGELYANGEPARVIVTDSDTITLFVEYLELLNFFVERCVEQVPEVCTRHRESQAMQFLCMQYGVSLAAQGVGV